MHILGLDLGTVCGAADGPPGQRPQAIWTWNLEDAGHGRAARFALWQVWLQEYFLDIARRLLEEDRGALDKIRVYYEQPLTLGALIQMTQSKKGLQTSDDRISFDRGLVGILEAVAFNAGIRHIEAVNVHEARRALTGDYNADKEKVEEYCRMLGWNIANRNESDSCCIWNYGAAKSNPRLAHLSTPLFGSR